MRTISVRGENGDDLTVYEFQHRRFLRKVRRMKLCTGELVKLMGDELIIVGTGERLVPVE